MDFKNCKYRVDKIPVGDLCLDHFTDLKQHETVFGNKKGLPSGITPDQLLRYIIMMFAPGSPCIESMPSINQRKTWVMKELGVECKQNGEFEKGWNDILINHNEEVRKRVVYFLRLQYSEVYANIRVAEMDFYTLLEMPTPGEDEEADSKNRLTIAGAVAERAKARATLINEIDGLKKKLVQNETSVILANEVTKFVAMENMGIKPEDYMEFAPKSVMPENAKASAMFPEIQA